MTTFTEVIKQEKEKCQLRPKPINTELQKSIDSLNKMFAENWTPLFDDDREYELWDKYISHIYFGESFNLLQLNKTSINKIEVLPVNWLSIKKFPYSLKTMYVIILKQLVQRKFANKFRGAIEESGFDKFFDAVPDAIPDFDFLINSMNNVLGENTFVEQENSIKFKDLVIEVPNLQLMKDCYSIKNEDSSDVVDFKNYKEETLDLFNLLNTHEKIYPTMVELLKKLKKLYLNEVHTYYNEKIISYVKEEFKKLCKTYSINYKDYLLYPVVSNDKLTWKIKFEKWANVDTFYFLNHLSTHKIMKSFSESDLYNSLKALNEVVENEAVQIECKFAAERIVTESFESLKQLSSSMKIDKEVDFDGHKISMSVKDRKLTLKYKDYTFYVNIHIPYSVHTLEKENKIEDGKKWNIAREEIQKNADLFIEFLNS